MTTQPLGGATAASSATGPALLPPPDGPLLEATDLAVSFSLGSALIARLRHEAHVLHAVDGVELTIPRGEALALVGESGSGKSTLARALAGLQRPDRGEIRLDGKVLPARRSRADQRKIQMVFQDPYSSLNPRLTVGGILHELLRVHHVVAGSEVESYTRELLGLVGLGEEAVHAYPRQFSGGQRQRVSIARALALEPELLVADEPVSALDVSVQATVLNLLDDLRHRLGLTMLFIAHNMAVVRHVCDRVAVMYLGRIVETAPTQELFTNPRHPYTQGLLKAVPRLAPGRVSTAEAVVGDPPSPINLPSGCRFHPRCPLAQDVCHTDDPELAASPESAGLHSAACHFAWTPAPVAHVPEVIAEEPA
jgi:oligopeptide transport system ATP-binding protein